MQMEKGAPWCLLISSLSQKVECVIQSFEEYMENLFDGGHHVEPAVYSKIFVNN